MKQYLPVSFRRILAAAIFLLLLVAGNTQSAIAYNSPSSRQLCTKLGIFKIMNSSRFRCTLANGRKIWVIKPGVSISTRVVPAYEKLYGEFRDRAIASAKKSYPNEIEWIFSPTISLTRQQMTKTQILIALSPWLEIGIETRGLRVFVLDENGAAIYTQKTLERPGCRPTPASEIAFHSGAQSGWLECMGSRDAMLVLMLGSSITSLSTGTIDHETTHLGQAGLLLRGLNQTQNPPFSDDVCWIFETEATLYQNLFSGDVDGYRGSSRKAFQTLRDKYSLSNSSDWLRFLQEREGTNNLDCWDASYRYNTLFLYEKIYIDFGATKVNNWRINGAIVGWKSAFVAEFGMTTAEWYSTSAIPYILDQIK